MNDSRPYRYYDESIMAKELNKLHEEVDADADGMKKMKRGKHTERVKHYFESHSNSEKELVNHPDHYNKVGRKECWDEMIDIFGPEAVAVFDVLSAYKYHYRAGLKDGNPSEQDKAKIENYMKHAEEMKKSFGSWGSATDMAMSTICDMKKILEG